MFTFFFALLLMLMNMMLIIIIYLLQADACELLKTNEMNQLFSSHQCTHNLEINKSKIRLPYELCYQSMDQIVKDITQAVTDKFNVHQINIVYISSDRDDQLVWHSLSERLPHLTIVSPTTSLYGGEVIDQIETPPRFMIDLYLLSYANYFVGNCISSFSAFPSRLRTYSFHLNRTTKFFAQDILEDNFFHDEL